MIATESPVRPLESFSVCLCCKRESGCEARLSAHVVVRFRCSLHASCLQLAFEEAIHITGALEIEAGFGVAELQEEARGIDGIESLLHRKITLVHQTGDEVLHNLLLHVLEFCLRYVHAFVSLSIARWGQTGRGQCKGCRWWSRGIMS